MTNLNFATALLCLSVISACGGGGGGGGGTDFASLASQGQTLIENYIDSSPTIDAQMPTGSARFEGVAGYSIYGDATDALTDPDAISRVILDADFSNDRVSGELTDFHSSDDIALNGSLSITNGTIDGNVMSADISGDLSASGITETVSGEMDGTFVWDDAAAVAGTIDTGHIDIFGDSVIGVFGAER